MAIFSTWFNHRPHVGVLKKADRPALEALLNDHRAAACFPIAWIERYGVSSPSRHAFFEFVGVRQESRVLSMALIVGQSLAVIVGERCVSELGEFCRGRLVELRTIVGTEVAVEAFRVGASVKEHRVELRQPQYCLEADSARIVSSRVGSPGVSSIAQETVARLRIATRGDTFPFLEATLSMYEEETGLRLHRHEIEAFELSVKQKIREGRAWLIYDDAGQLIFKAGIGLPTKRQAHLEGVYVAPESRRQGIGRLAMLHLCSELAGNFETITLTANRDNDAALNLYRGMGFSLASDFMTVYIHED